MESAADHNLLERWVTQRDADAFNALTRRYSGLVFSAALRILGNSSDAEDVAQSCFETLAIANNPPTGALAPWLHRVATNRALDALRTARNRTVRERVYAESHETHVEIAWDDIYAHVDAAINELPDELRVVLLERFYASRSAEEIARDLGINRRTVYHRSERGIEEVRNTLRKRGIPVASATLAVLLPENLSTAAALPASLSATLGQLAVAGIASTYVTSPLAVAVTTGGILVMKKALIGVVVMVVAALGLWRYLNSPLPSAVPAPDSYVARSSENTPTGGTGGIPTDSETPADTTPLPIETNLPQSAGGDITGRIYNSNSGAGVPGLRPRVSEVVNNSASEKQLTAAGSESDAHGDYHIRNLPSGTYAIEPPASPEYPRSRPAEMVFVTVVADSIAQRVDFALNPGMKVRGFVRDSNQQPVANAVVVAQSGFTWNAVNVESAATGAYEVFLPSGDGSFQIMARKDERKSPRLTGLLTDDTQLDLTLAEAMSSSISGMVLDEQNHRVAGALVGASGAGLDISEQSRTVETDEKGQFHIDMLAAGQYGIYLAPPHGELRILPQTLQLTTELLEGEALEGLQLALGANLSISGHVVTQNGTPLSGATVLAQSRVAQDDFKQRQAEGYTKSASDGTFVVAGLEPGDFALLALRAGQTTYTNFDTPYPAGATDVKLVLGDAENLVRGQVIHSETGAPVTKFRLYTMDGGPFSDPDDLLYYQPAKHVFHPEGRFEFDASVGNVTIGVIATGYAPTVTNADILESQKITEVTVALNPSGRIEGQVVDTHGAGIPGVNLFWGSPPNIYGLSQWLCQTDSEGRFTSDTIPENAEILTAGHSAYPLQEKPIAPRMKFVLEAGGVLKGRVRSKSEPIQGAQVGLSQHGKILVSFFTNTNLEGDYLLKNIPAGEYAMAVILENTKMEQTVVLEAGETKEVDIEIELGGVTVLGTVTGAEDPERVYLSLDVATAAGSQQFRCRGNSDGSYQMDHVVSGTGQLKAEARRLGASTMQQVITVEIPQNENVTQDIHFTSGGTVSGVVSGLSAARAGSVVALSGEHDLSSIVSVEDVQVLTRQVDFLAVANVDCNPAGEYSIDSLMPGPYTLVAVSANAEAELDVAQWQWSIAVVKIEEDGQALIQDFGF